MNPHTFPANACETLSAVLTRSAVVLPGEAASATLRPEGFGLALTSGDHQWTGETVEEVRNSLERSFSGRGEDAVDAEALSRLEYDVEVGIDLIAEDSDELDIAEEELMMDYRPERLADMKPRSLLDREEWDRFGANLRQAMIYADGVRTGVASRDVAERVVEAVCVAHFSEAVGGSPEALKAAVTVFSPVTAREIEAEGLTGLRRREEAWETLESLYPTR